MEISELTLKLIIILIPGAIATRIYQKVTIHEKGTSFGFITSSILFGGFSYVLTGFIGQSCWGDDRLVSFWDNVPGTPIPYDMVLETCIVGVFIGLIVSATDHFKVLNRIAKAIKITNKYGDENLYSYFLNASNVSEVYVRDHETKTIYHGIIDAFSENDECCEIVLLDVVAYSIEDAHKLYELDKVYLSRPRNQITIELPITQSQNGKTTESPPEKSTSETS